MPNTILAIKTPVIAPNIWSKLKIKNIFNGISFFKKRTKETTGLNWLLKDSNAVIKKYSAKK